MSNSIPAGKVVDDLGIRIGHNHGLPVGGLLIVRTMYPTSEVGLIIGTASGQSWIDHVGMLRAAEIIMQNDMLISAINADDEAD